KIRRDELIQDIRELTNLLENAHPDPYSKGGGKIAYHRRLQKLIKDIPFDGMEKQEFFVHLQQFIAKVGDGHTRLIEAESNLDKQNPRGLPLYLEPIEERLVVKAVTTEEYLPLIGCILMSVEDIPFEELVKRQEKLVGFENVYQLLSFLGKTGSLFYRDYLKQLIPEWNSEAQIHVALRHPNGEEKAYLFPPSEKVTFPLMELKTKIDLPETGNSSFSYHFIGPEENIALLSIENMMTYREAFEYWDASGSTVFENLGRSVYKIHNNKDPPEDYKEVIDGIPSVTETFVSLIQEVKNRKSRVLIVDLRNNSGGNSSMIQILLYFLVGFDRTISLLMENTEIRKLSKHLHHTSTKGVELEMISYRDLVPVTINDYDFSKDPSFHPGNLRQTVIADLTRTFKKMPSFNREFESGEFEAYYLPKRIVVLCSSSTFSSGFNLMTDLYRLGALIVGVPSGQAGNSCGDNRTYELKNSKMRVSFSTKYFVAFPDDPEKGSLLKPHYPLTYEKSAYYGFDKNAVLLYALDIVKELEEYGK
ncbi:MAG: S41 family peptidase, partial [Candidatus Bathyarchaeota archaeon]|nr:S41 family peptidase [Candidatus Bathyarchaeota archaeon]